MRDRGKDVVANFFDALAIGDVLRGTGHAERLAGGIDDDPAARLDDALGAVVAHDAMQELELAAALRARCSTSLRARVAVAGVDPFEVSRERQRSGARVQAEDAVELA